MNATGFESRPSLCLESETSASGLNCTQRPFDASLCARMAMLLVKGAEMITYLKVIIGENYGERISELGVNHR